jgi:hypothetical protein
MPSAPVHTGTSECLLDAKQACLEERVSTAVPNGWNQFHRRIIKWRFYQIEMENENQLRRCESQRYAVRLRSHGNFERTARHGAAGRRFPIRRWRRSMTGAVAILHVGHARGIGTRKRRQRTTEEASQDGHPKRDGYCQPCACRVEAEVHRP